jgi:hypothetical protein
MMIIFRQGTVYARMEWISLNEKKVWRKDDTHLQRIFVAAINVEEL